MLTGVPSKGIGEAGVVEEELLAVACSETVGEAGAVSEVGRPRRRNLNSPFWYESVSAIQLLLLSLQRRIYIAPCAVSKST